MLLGIALPIVVRHHRDVAYRTIDKGANTLGLNPSHIILKKLLDVDPASGLPTLISKQIYERALLVAGSHPDPSSMAARVQKIIETALTNS